MPNDTIEADLLTPPELNRRPWKGSGVSWREFVGPGGARECFLTVEPDSNLSFEDQLQSVQQRYENALQAINLPPESAVFRRFHLSDVINQQSPFAATAIAD